MLTHRWQRAFVLLKLIPPWLVPCSYLYLRTAKAPAPSPCGCGRHHSEGADGEPAAGSSGGQAADGRATFDRLADAYDSLISVDETFMGLKLMRRWLMRHAEVCCAGAKRTWVHANRGSYSSCRLLAWLAQGLHLANLLQRTSFPELPFQAPSLPPCPLASLFQGDVLEVSAGTGRNLPYYPLGRMRSLTLTDTSRPMLVNAADKYAAMLDKGDAPAATPVRFELADAQQLVVRAGAGEPSSSGVGSSSEAGSSSGTSSSSGAAGGGEAEAPATPRQQGEGAAGAASPPHRPPLKQWQTFAPRSFDVVVDTFGLCSQEDPVTALKVGWEGGMESAVVCALWLRGQSGMESAGASALWLRRDAAIA